MFLVTDADICSLSCYVLLFYSHVLSAFFIASTFRHYLYLSWSAFILKVPFLEHKSRSVLVSKFSLPSVI